MLVSVRIEELRNCSGPTLELRRKAQFYGDLLLFSGKPRDGGPSAQLAFTFTDLV